MGLVLRLGALCGVVAFGGTSGGLWVCRALNCTGGVHGIRIDHCVPPLNVPPLPVARCLVFRLGTPSMWMRASTLCPVAPSTRWHSAFQ